MKSLLQLKRSIFLVIGFACVALWVPQLQAKDQLVVGYFSLAPHGFENNQGAAVEYFKLIARRLKWNVRFELLPLARMMATDRVDIVLYLGRNEEREKHFIFSEKPLMQMQGAIAISNQNTLSRIRNISDIKPLKIGVWSRGFKSEMMRTEGLSLTEETGAAIEERVLQKIVIGRLDAFYSPEMASLRFAIEKGQFSKQLKVLSLPEPPNDLHVAFRKKFPAHLIRDFNFVHAQFEAKTSYKDYFDNYRK